MHTKNAAEALARNILEGTEGDEVGALTVTSHAALELLRIAKAFHTECVLDTGETLHILIVPRKDKQH